MQKVVKKAVDFAVKIGNTVYHFVETAYEKLVMGLDWLWTKIKVCTNGCGLAGRSEKPSQVSLTELTLRVRAVGFLAGSNCQKRCQRHVDLTPIFEVISPLNMTGCLSLVLQLSSVYLSLIEAGESVRTANISFSPHAPVVQYGPLCTLSELLPY